MKYSPEDFTFYQVSALAAIPVAKEIRGEEVRELLRANGSKKRPSGFSKAMQKLEDCGLVESYYTSTRIKDRTIREKWFKITGEGEVLLREVKHYFVGIKFLKS